MQPSVANHCPRCKNKGEYIWRGLSFATRPAASQPLLLMLAKPLQREMITYGECFRLSCGLLRLFIFCGFSCFLMLLYVLTSLHSAISFLSSLCFHFNWVFHQVSYMFSEFELSYYVCVNLFLPYNIVQKPFAILYFHHFQIQLLFYHLVHVIWLCISLWLYWWCFWRMLQLTFIAHMRHVLYVFVWGIICQTEHFSNCLCSVFTEERLSSLYI